MLAVDRDETHLAETIVPPRAAAAQITSLVAGVRQPEEIERDEKDIDPSTLFRLTLLAGRFLPFVRRIEQTIEGQRFSRWLRGGSS